MNRRSLWYVYVTMQKIMNDYNVFLLYKTIMIDYNVFPLHKKIMINYNVFPFHKKIVINYIPISQKDQIMINYNVFPLHKKIMINYNVFPLHQLATKPAKPLAQARSTSMKAANQNFIVRKKNFWQLLHRLEIFFVKECFERLRASEGRDRSCALNCFRTNVAKEAQFT